MKFSPYMKSLTECYNLRPTEVAFAILHANGLNWSESFAIIYNTLDEEQSTNQTRASNLLKRFPKISTLDAKLTMELKKNKEAIALLDKFNSEKAALKAQGKSAPGSWDENATPAENINRTILEEFPGLKGKEKIDTAFRYGKVLGVDVEQRDTIHTFIPLSCYECEFYRQKMEQKNNVKD